MSSPVARRESILSLAAKISISEAVISDCLSRFFRPVVVWSGGKDSTLLLHLTKSVLEREGKKLLPALFIDHGDHFKETNEIMSQISGAWGVNLKVARNDDVLNHVVDGKVTVASLDESNRSELKRLGFEGDSFEYTLDNEVGNHLLKTLPMKTALEKYRFDSVFTGVRWDENPSRSAENFMSRRSNPEHVRIHPILPFTERDIWDYTFKFKLPVHPLYKQGYRSIDGIRDSVKTGDKPAWEQDLENTGERSGRSQNKEQIMDKLRAMGYM